jgi:hypothetical protein
MFLIVCYGCFPSPSRTCLSLSVKWEHINHRGGPEHSLRDDYSTHDPGEGHSSSVLQSWPDQCLLSAGQGTFTPFQPL